MKTLIFFGQMFLIFAGTPQYFFDGDHRNEHVCSCAEDDSCLSNEVTTFPCNCDANLPIWAQDIGYITAKDLLPITQVFYGPLLYDSEKANFTLGRLRCSGICSKIHISVFKLNYFAFRKCCQRPGRFIFMCSHENGWTLPKQDLYPEKLKW